MVVVDLPSLQAVSHSSHAKSRYQALVFDLVLFQISLYLGKMNARLLYLN